MNTVFSTNTQLTIASAEGLYFFRTEEIIRLEASSNYTLIHFTNRKPMLVARILGDYESMLSGYGFVRTHRSHLINKQYVRFIDAVGNIIMEDTSKAEISRRKRKDVLRELRTHFPTQKFAA